MPRTRRYFIDNELARARCGSGNLRGREEFYDPSASFFEALQSTKDGGLVICYCIHIPVSLPPLETGH